MTDIKTLPQELKSVNFSELSRKEFLDLYNQFLKEGKYNVCKTYIRKCLESKKSTRIDFNEENDKLNYIDIKLCESNLQVYHLHYHGDDELLQQSYRTYTHILDQFRRQINEQSPNNIKSIDKLPYGIKVESQCRIGMALALARVSNSHEHASNALEHIRRALKLDKKNALGYAVYGYILDRLLDKYKESRQYLEYSMNLNKDLGCAHMWYAMLLDNYSEEFIIMDQEIHDMLEKKTTEQEEKESGLDEMGTTFHDKLVKQFSIKNKKNLMQWKRKSSISTSMSNSYTESLSQSQKRRNTVDDPNSPQLKNKTSNSSQSQSQSKDEMERAKELEEKAKLKQKREEIAKESKTLNTLAIRTPDGELFEVINNPMFEEYREQSDVFISDDPLYHFRVAIENEPKNSRYFSNYACWLIKNQEFDKAKATLLHSVVLDRNNVVALCNLAFILALPKYREYKKAKDLYKEALEKSKNKCKYTHFNLGRLLMNAFNDWITAKDHFMKALQHGRKNSHFNFWMGIGFKFHEFDDEKAENYLENAKSLLGKVQQYEAVSYLQQATVCMQKGRHDIARYVLNTALVINRSLKPVVTRLSNRMDQIEKKWKKNKRLAPWVKAKKKRMRNRKKNE